MKSRPKFFKTLLKVQSPSPNRKILLSLPLQNKKNLKDMANRKRKTFLKIKDYKLCQQVTKLDKNLNIITHYYNFTPPKKKLHLMQPKFTN